MNTERSLTLAMLIGRWICDAYVALDTDGPAGDTASAIDLYALASLACGELGAAGLFASTLPAAIDKLAGAILKDTGGDTFDHPDVTARYAVLVAMELT